MKTTKVALALTAVTLVVTAAACNGKLAGVPQTAGGLVPANANIVIGLKPHDILTDPDIVELIDEAMGAQSGYETSFTPRSLDDAMLMVERMIGVDIRDITEVIVFLDMEADDYDYVGGILKGNFDEELIIDLVELFSGRPAQTSNHRGFTIRTFDGVAVCFLDSGTVAVGPPYVVTDVIDVAAGVKESVGGDMLDAYASLDGMWLQAAVDFGEIMSLTGLLEEEIPGAPEIPDVDMLEDMEVMGMGIGKSGDTLTMEGKMYFPDAASAEEAKNDIDTQRALMDTEDTGDLPPEFIELVESVTTTVDGRCVTATMHITMSQLEDLIAAEWPMGATGGVEETAYNADRQQIQAAVAEFMTRPSDPSYHHTIGDVPVVNYDAFEVNGSEVIPGKDYYPIAICPLLTGSYPMGILKDAPPSANLMNCLDNGANAETGMASCQASCTGSYIWLTTEDGDIASVCIGDDCNAENRDGFQVAYP